MGCSKVKLSGAMPAAKEASASRSVAPRCIRWNALSPSPWHAPRHDQVRLLVRTQPEYVFPDRFELPPLVDLWGSAPSGAWKLISRLENEFSPISQFFPRPLPCHPFALVDVL
jgi:hypothetical protein